PDAYLRQAYALQSSRERAGEPSMLQGGATILRIRVRLNGDSAALRDRNLTERRARARVNPAPHAPPLLRKVKSGARRRATADGRSAPSEARRSPRRPARARCPSTPRLRSDEGSGSGFDLSGPGQGPQSPESTCLSRPSLDRP